MTPREWSFLSPSVSLDSKPTTIRPMSSVSFLISLSVPQTGAVQ